MRYIPTTENIERDILENMGLDNFDDLIKIVPDKLRSRLDVGIGKPLSEMELLNLSNSIAETNQSAFEKINFIGGGVYDHFIPAAVNFISSRSEFYTAYTPYQAEVSQGTLQAMYEFQTLICELSGMDASNASLYDGASAVAEACSMALAISRKKKIILSSLLTPQYQDVIKTYMANRGVELLYIPDNNGKTDIDWISSNLEDAACVIIQSPNYYGQLEDWSLFKEKMINSKALLIAVSNPLDLSIIKSPGECGADIYAGEGQSLGNAMAYGGPYLGLIATKTKYVRKMPGRIIGKTTDIEGKEGFVLTLQTREQHIRRENATSNICTNQGLLALRATIYLSLMGKVKYPELAELCTYKAHYTADKISQIPGFSVQFGNEFLKEFVIKCPSSAKEIIRMGEEKGFFLSSLAGDQTDRLLLIAVTEKRTKDEIDMLIDFLSDPVTN
ncbi:MAG: aminomethyl-transferring glycine dehydrogenase subunit GcvPA [Candidatus Marinimicrobia bacterium]|jgi:glycine dehydrogenase subunit 1|nr:aminomethyl-transferring glycine dehydrogenase subunit GcvPA [Candidatus Neomarinimicrobiota bacterium]MBT3633380.1 aminomethyl-transferring glycine dehydrogenase subunit GcvPA [Candidatus Neomarinimicrobiota bacterium]MBT3681523.1 aminomethyl-transferring glycine dehydrogenase subunit GcvPA [Candidatus Neomarinimicrobiota bacterium]MBT3758510.1 aminomethyl-transferring glycine dehydrogenase subunit GcvPA [Candidatus Neomarinimicrobiota bacterium]MBT3894836.1 aminomethyl-transferring glycine